MWEAQIVLSTKHYKFYFSVLYILEMYNNFIKKDNFINCKNWSSEYEIV